MYKFSMDLYVSYDTLSNKIIRNKNSSVPYRTTLICIVECEVIIDGYGLVMSRRIMNVLVENVRVVNVAVDNVRVGNNVWVDNVRVDNVTVGNVRVDNVAEGKISVDNVAVGNVRAGNFPIVTCSI